MDISPHAHAITAYTARRHVGQHADREHVAASGRAMGSPARPGDARETGQAEQLTPAERREVQQLRATDAKVRAHERAHVAAGGSLVRGGASYRYTQGPDGRRYAVAGEVRIDTSGVPGDPAATLERAERVRRAALAPADPSPQDRAVAAQAAAMIAHARAELAAERTREGGDHGSSTALSNTRSSRPDDRSDAQALAAYRTDLDDAPDVRAHAPVSVTA